MKTFGQELRKMRAKYDLTQAEVAKIAGISQSVYATIERGVTSDQSEAAKLVRKKVIDDREEVKRHSMKKRRMADKHRIPNIPDFYERLRKIEEDGLKENDPELLKLQEELGVGEKRKKRRGKAKPVAKKKGRSLGEC